ncbi:hypothetical protein [Nocardia wallacei]|uniref:hypothetical protein n=1 Tax=Nocardia wallacei TaxID=480035 RepID=UPI0024588763|nr:hypothetical protein [Nocardia wallacei]
MTSASADRRNGSNNSGFTTRHGQHLGSATTENFIARTQYTAVTGQVLRTRARFGRCSSRIGAFGDPRQQHGAGPPQRKQTVFPALGGDQGGRCPRLFDIAGGGRRGGAE